MRDRWTNTPTQAADFERTHGDGYGIEIPTLAEILRSEVEDTYYLPARDEPDVAVGR